MRLESSLISVSLKFLRFAILLIIFIRVSNLASINFSLFILSNFSLFLYYFLSAFLSIFYLNSSFFIFTKLIIISISILIIYNLLNLLVYERLDYNYNLKSVGVLAYSLFTILTLLPLSLKLLLESTSISRLRSKYFFTIFIRLAIRAIYKYLVLTLYTFA